MLGTSSLQGLQPSFKNLKSISLQNAISFKGASIKYVRRFSGFLDPPCSHFGLNRKSKLPQPLLVTLPLPLPLGAYVLNGWSLTWYRLDNHSSLSVKTMSQDSQHEKHRMKEDPHHHGKLVRNKESIHGLMPCKTRLLRQHWHSCSLRLCFRL